MPHDLGVELPALSYACMVFWDLFSITFFSLPQAFSLSNYELLCFFTLSMLFQASFFSTWNTLLILLFQDHSCAPVVLSTTSFKTSVPRNWVTFLSAPRRPCIHLCPRTSDATTKALISAPDRLTSMLQGVNFFRVYLWFILYPKCFVQCLINGIHPEIY